MKKNTAKYAQFVSSSSIALLLLTSCGESKEMTVDEVSSNETEEEKETAQEGNPELEAVQDIVSTQDWKRFKKYWKHLSGIEPKIDSTNSWNHFHMYNNTLSDEARAKMGRELDSCQISLDKLYTDNKLDEGSYDVLKRLTNERYTYITEGYGYMFMTRMAPPPGAYDRVHLMEDLEARIDTLHQLKEKDLITDSLLQKAMEQIQQDIESFALTNFEQGHYSFYTSALFTEEKKDSSVFELYYRRFQDNHAKRIAQMKENKSPSENIERAEKMYQEDLESLQKVEVALPTLRLLIVDLEN